MPTSLDLERLSRLLERTCAQALHDCRIYPGEEAWLRAAGRLDGILQGLHALCRALDDQTQAEEIFATARRIVDLAREELRHLQSE